MRFNFSLPMFLLLLLALPVLADASPPALLSRTGQQSCWDLSGTPTQCVNSGQDGAIRSGVEWPSPRFTDNNDGTITDKLTGLTWSTDANQPVAAKNWQQALEAVAALNLAAYKGKTDWRLPNRTELLSLVNAEPDIPATWLTAQGFLNVQADNYWTSTSSSFDPASAWPVNFGDGLSSAVLKADQLSLYYVWPVRGDSVAGGGSVALPRTGQTGCWDATGASVVCTATGQDGQTLSGAAWPAARFTRNGDRTVTDELTGLIWSEDATPAGPAVLKTWMEALDYITTLNSGSYLGKADWRLPNRAELATLLHYQDNTVTQLQAAGFANVDYDLTGMASFWTSTSLPLAGSMAEILYLGWNELTAADKATTQLAVWPVRGGVLTYVPVAGVCGTSSGVTFDTAPASGLCSVGTASALSGSGPWTWSCAGLNNGTTATCSANITTFSVTFASGGNGSISGSTSQSVNYGSSTGQVTATPASGYVFANWTGTGSFAATSANPLIITNLTANLTITANFVQVLNGACGAASNVAHTAAPTTGFCAAGQASSLTGSGPWNWSCNGANGGTTASCSAVKVFLGDLSGDGSVGIEDAVMALKAYFKRETLSDSQKLAADVAPLDPVTLKPKGDSLVDLADVIVIMRRVVGAVSW